MEEDPFLWMMKFCEPTASHAAELADCPFAREFENFVESIPSPIPSSPRQSQSQSPPPSPVTPIRVVSLPGTPCSADQCVAEGDAAFHAPPENHESSHLEDPNPNDSCPEKVSSPEAKRATVVAEEEFDSETEAVETDGDEGVSRRTKVYSVDELISMLDKQYVANIAEIATIGTGRETYGLMNNGAAEVDAINGDHDFGGETENVEGIGGEKPSDSSGSSSSCEVLGYKSCEIELEGVKKGVEAANSAEKIVKYGREDGGVRSNGKRIEETNGRRRKLPPSCNGKQNAAGESSEKQSGSPPLSKEKGKGVGGSSEKRCGTLEFLGFLRKLIKDEDEDEDEDDDDVDCIETLKKSGMKIVKPRWWE